MGKVKARNDHVVQNRKVISFLGSHFGTERASRKAQPNADYAGLSASARLKGIRQAHCQDGVELGHLCGASQAVPSRQNGDDAYRPLLGVSSNRTAPLRICRRRSSQYVITLHFERVFGFDYVGQGRKMVDRSV